MKIPRTLGRYEVLDLLGRGGMGTLYRARDPRIGRFVAIKQLRPEFDTRELRDRFSREAAAAGSLSHPNIVTIYDVGEDEGLPFIAMEYVRGETFTDLVGLRPPLSVRRKLQLAGEVCAGLAHAHGAGIVHRDIKPANLIVGSEGIVKILDFGIAKLSSSTMTLPGSVLGTLNYMAPEQVRGMAVDARADIFAVGAVLYELLTHRQAFPGRAANEVLDRILNGVPEPIANACPDIDPRLADLVNFALEKNADQRIQEIAVLQKELENLRPWPSVAEPQRSVARRASPSLEQTGLLTSWPAAITVYRSAVSPNRDGAAPRPQIDEHPAAAEREIDEAQRAGEELAARRQRLLAVLGTAREAIQHERLDEAVALLEMLRNIDSGAPEVSDLAERLHGAQTAARLKADLDAILRDFEEALERNDLHSAGDRLSAANKLAPQEARVRSAQARLDQATALAARQAAEARALEVAQRLEEAAAHLDAGDLDGAADILTLATALAPHDARVDEFSARLREATERREAAERLARQIAELIDSAAQRLQSAGDQTSELFSARHDVDQALALAPGHNEALSLRTAIVEAIAAHREAARMKAAVNNARTRFANGKRRAAIRLLEEFQPPHPDIAAVLNELRAALQKFEEEQRAEQERIARQERVDALLADVQTSIRDKRFDAALQQLQSVEEIDPASPALVEFRELVHQEQAAIALAAELDITFANFDQHLLAGDPSAAADVLGTAAALAPADPRIEVARQRLEQEVAARQAAEARARDLEAKHTAAVASFERGDFQESRRLLHIAQDLDVDHARTAGLADLSERVESAIAQQDAAEAAKKRRQTADDLVAAAAARLQSAESQAGDLALAGRELDQALALEADHAGALAAKVTLDAAVAAGQKAAVIRASIRNARSRFANGKHHAAIRLLESLDPSSDPSVEETLKEFRQKLHDIDASLSDKERSVSPPPPSGDPRDGAEDATLTGVHSVAQEQPRGATGRLWIWMVAAAVLLLIVLGTLYLRA